MTVWVIANRIASVDGAIFQKRYGIPRFFTLRPSVRAVSGLNWISNNKGLDFLSSPLFYYAVNNYFNSNLTEII